MSDYIVKAIWSEGNGHNMTIKGLKNDEGEPDTVLWLMGMVGTCAHKDGIIDELYRCLYDEYQVNSVLKDGDTLIFKAGEVYKYLTYDGIKINLPELRFICQGVDVLPNCEISKSFIT